jgi:hypothetical protein
MKLPRQDDGLMTTAEAAERLGLSAGQFRKLTAELRPAKTYPNPHYRSGPAAFLWSRRQIANLGRRKAVQAARERKGGRARRSPNAWAVRFTARHGNALAALGPAAEALFSLNRYTRHACCAEGHRAEILELKSQFIALLCRLEKIDRVVRFSLTRPGKGCWGCEGDDGHQGTGCGRCEFTGWHRDPRIDRLLSFHFTIDGVHYAWMQPERLVAFEVKVDEEQTELHGQRETALSMGRARFSEAKALLRWVIAEHAAAPAEDIDQMIAEFGETPDA